MIHLNFEIDEAELAENLEGEPGNAEESLIGVTLFIMPVRLQINGKELFALKKIKKDDPWIGIPIVNLATEGLYRVEQIPVLKKVNYDLPEAIGVIEFLLLDKDSVRIIYKRNDIDEIVSYIDLLNAFKNFTSQVRTFLNERVPQLRDHPYWGTWVRGGVE